MVFNMRAEIPERNLLLAFAFSLFLHAVVLARLGVLAPAAKVAGGGPLQVHIVPQLGDRQASDEVRLADPAVLRSLPQQLIQEIQVQKPVESVRPLALPEPSAKVISRQQSTALIDTAANQHASQQYPAIGVPSVGSAGGLRSVELEVEILSGPDRKLIATAQHQYISQDGARYSVGVRPLTSADPSNATPDWQLKVGGVISADGLLPLGFEARGAKGVGLITLREDLSTQQKEAATLLSRRNPDRILDRQSLLYQFTLRPPQPDGGSFGLSDGKKVKIYSYRQEDGGVFSVPPLGEIRTIKLLITDVDGSEKIELWLIPDLHFLPVKMRHVSSTGDITEQVVLSLKYQ